MRPNQFVLRFWRILVYSVSLLVCLNLAKIGPQRCAAQTRPSTSVQAVRADPYTPHLPARAYAYHRANRILYFVGLGWRIIGIVLFLRLGASTRAGRIARSLDRKLTRKRSRADAAIRDEDTSVTARAPGLVEVSVFYLIYAVLMLVWMLPVSLCSLNIERTFGFSNESIGLLLKDEIMSLGVNCVIIPIIWLAYWLYTHRPKSWWLILWATLTPLILFNSIIYPVVVSPLYNRYTPLAPGSLRDRILALATKAGIEHSRVFVENTSLRTSHVNAYVTGIGPSTRIVINDTALRQLPDDQILAMVGHEMGHYVEHHVLIGTAVSVVGSLGLLALLSVLLPRLALRFSRSFRFDSLNDMAALPLVFLTLTLLNLAFQPISSAISRTMEHRADAYGLRLTGLHDATARLMVGFAERDLSDPDPPWLFHLWFGTHPTLLERIEFARGSSGQ